MQRIFYCFALLLSAVVQLQCNDHSPAKDTRIGQVNYWYSRQCYYWQINSDSVLKYSQLIEAASGDLPPVYQAMALLGKARYNVKGKTNIAMKQYAQVIQMLEHTGADSVMARAHNSLGICYVKKSDYSTALDNFFKALRLYEKCNDIVNIGGVLANIGEVYQVKNDVPTAKKYILRSMETSKKNGNVTSYLDAAQTLANIYGMGNQFDSAIAIDRMGIAVADSIGSAKLKSAFYNNLGNCYMYSNRLDSARHYFSRCLVLDSANGIAGFMADNYLTLGQLSARENKAGEAAYFLKRAIALSDSIHENQVKSHAWSAMAELYRQGNDLLMAIVAKDSAAAIKDRIINEKTENKIAELQELYETEKKEQTIALQQVKLSRQRILLTGSTILLASLFLSGWLLYRRYRIKKERELQATILQQREKATLDILQAEDQERRRIAAELHDGVGQVMLAAWINLQALEPQIHSLQPQQQAVISKAISMVGEGCKEVRQVSHAMMPNALLNKGLAGAVKDFTQQIDQHILSIHLHTEGMDKPLHSMVETILYRVIQECVNNTIRHAAARDLHISIHNTEAGISLLMEDNGKGFNVAQVQQHAGLGMQNIKRRIAFLKGTAEWDSSPGNGTVVTIFIPTKEQHV